MTESTLASNVRQAAPDGFDTSRRAAPGEQRTGFKAGAFAVLRRVVAVEPIWRVLDGILRVPRMVDTARRQVENSRGPAVAAVAALADLAPGGVVRSGLCQGLRFPSARSTFSTVGPMLLGLYERPLQQRLLELTGTRGYDLILDVGAADGFYAVGLATRCPEARVVAFDSEPAARDASRAMAAVNGVSDRVEVRGYCDSRTITDAVRSSRRALILSDCEGFERQLFPEGMGETLAQHDVVIELHDWVDYGISPQLRKVFGATHRVERIRAEDDLEMVRTAHAYLPALADYEWPVRHALVCENRRNIPGEWLVALSQREHA